MNRMRRHHTRKHKTKRRQTRKHKGGSKLVPLLSRWTSPRPVSTPVKYSATNLKRIEQLKKMYENLNRKENAALAQKAKNNAYAAELKRTAQLQALAQEEEAELVNIERKFRQGTFVPVSNQQLLENQLAHLEDLEERASRASNPRSVASNNRNSVRSY